MIAKTHGIPHKSSPKLPHHEPLEPAPIELTPVQPPPVIPTKPSRADRLEAAIDEIAAVVSDRFPISRTIQDIIKRVKSE
jgi:hypothetical protein